MTFLCKNLFFKLNTKSKMNDLISVIKKIEKFKYQDRNSFC